MPDNVRPYITKTIPNGNASGYNPYSDVYVQFSETMLNSTITSTSVGMYTDPLVGVPITLSYNEGQRLLTINPGTMSVNTRYAVVVSGTVSDLSGNAMLQDYWFNFWTGVPSGWVFPTTPQLQPEGYDLSGNLEVSRTAPENYSTNLPIADINPVRIFFSDDLAIGNRNYFGTGTSPNPLMLGVGFFEEPAISIASYITVQNQEVLGDPYISHTPASVSYSLRGSIVEMTMSNMLSNNEYLITVGAGLEGLRTNPLQEDYQFVFTSSYSPLYAGYNVVRLRIGPMLQMAMAWIPNDTLNRFIYEASREANRISPIAIDSNNPPWWVVEFVIYQGTLNALYAALAIFAASGAGIRKRLADLEIEKDARGLMPAIQPILDDLRKLRDKALEELITGGAHGIAPSHTVKGYYDPRRPITNRSWRRLPLRNLQGSQQQPVYAVSEYSRTALTALGKATEEWRDQIQWIYSYELAGVSS